jgi:hypothetical protein
MNGGNGPALGVGQEQWDAIGGSNSDRHPSVITDEGITRTRSRNTRRIAPEGDDVASVHLIEPCDLTHTQRHGDALPGTVERQLQFTCREEMPGNGV